MNLNMAISKQNSEIQRLVRGIMLGKSTAYTAER